MIGGRHRLAALGTGLLFLVGAAPAVAATHYASPAGAAANWPCESAASPCDLTTGIEGTESSRPASDDEVIVQSGQYHEGSSITAPVAENIHGSGDVKIDAIGITHEFLVLGGASQQSELTGVQIYESGSSDSAAAASHGNTLFADDVLVSEASDGAAVLLGPGDLLRDSVADATASGGTAVSSFVDGTGAISMRNVTAYAAGTNGIDVNGYEGGCGALDVSMRNVIAEAPGTGGVTLTGGNRCVSGTVTLDIDYSDFDFTKDVLGTGVSLGLGASNINQPAVFSDPATYAFEEKPNSPTVDMGTNDPQDGSADPDGRPRFLGSAPDMGAYELPAPYPVTDLVAGLSTTGATLTGTVDSEGSGLTTSYDYQYGTSTNYGSFLPVPLGTEPGEAVFPDPQPVYATLTGLQPGTTYDYRLVAKNSDGRTFGANRTFTTEAPATLTIRHGGDGEGNILVDGPTGMIAGCLDRCPLNVLTETPYTLRARPLAGSSFAGWNGGGCSGKGTCTVTPSGNTTLTATFAVNLPRLSRVKLTGLSRHKPKLRFTVVAGAGNKLSSLKITLPTDLTFAGSRHGVKLSVHGAKLKLRHGVLTITPAKSATKLTVTLGGASIAIAKPKHRRLSLEVTATETAGGRVTASRLSHRT